MLYAKICARARVFVCVCVCGCLHILLFWYTLILFYSTLVIFLHFIFHLSFCSSLCFFLTFSLSPSFFSWLPLNTTLVGFVISALGTGSDSTWPASHWLTDASSEFEIRCVRSYPVEVLVWRCTSVRVTVTWRKHRTANTPRRKLSLLN